AADLLANIPLFNKLQPDEFRELQACAKQAMFRAGDTVFRQGEPGSTLYVLEAGIVKIVLLSEVGDEVILATMGPGEFFGELAVFDGEDRSATVEAVTDVRALVIARGDLRPL